MNKISDHIYYLSKSKEPLSAEVFIIKKDNSIYIYDVGNGEKYLEVINKILENKHIILSHFHPDHIFNMTQIQYNTLYQSKNTSKYTKIDNYLVDYQSDNIKIFEFPSTHAKGCLALEIDDYLLVGDAMYPNHKGLYNVNFLKMQIDYLKQSKVNYIIRSHKEPLVESKETVLHELLELYSRRNPKEPYLSI